MECAKDEKCIQIFQLPPSREFFMSARRAARERTKAKEQKGRTRERWMCRARVEPQTNTCNKNRRAADKKHSSQTRKININSHSSTRKLVLFSTNSFLTITNNAFFCSLCGRRQLRAPATDLLLFPPKSVPNSYCIILSFPLPRFHYFDSSLREGERKEKSGAWVHLFYMKRKLAALSVAMLRIGQMFPQYKYTTFFVHAFGQSMSFNEAQFFSKGWMDIMMCCYGLFLHVDYDDARFIFQFSNLKRYTITNKVHRAKHAYL